MFVCEKVSLVSGLLAQKHETCPLLLVLGPILGKSTPTKQQVVCRTILQLFCCGARASVCECVCEFVCVCLCNGSQIITIT